MKTSQLRSAVAPLSPHAAMSTNFIEMDSAAPHVSVSTTRSSSFAAGAAAAPGATALSAQNSQTQPPSERAAVLDLISRQRFDGSWPELEMLPGGICPVHAASNKFGLDATVWTTLSIAVCLDRKVPNLKWMWTRSYSKAISFVASKTGWRLAAVPATPGTSGAEAAGLEIPSEIRSVLVR